MDNESIILLALALCCLSKGYGTRMQATCSTSKCASPLSNNNNNLLVVKLNHEWNATHLEAVNEKHLLLLFLRA